MSSSPVASRKQSSTSRVERPAPRVHLHDEALEHSRVAIEELHQPRAIGALGVAHLRQPDRDRPFGGLDAGIFIAVAVPARRRSGPALVVTAAQGIGLLLLQTLLHEIAQTELGELGEQVGFALHASAEQAVDFLPHHCARRYPSHWPEPPSVDLPVFRMVTQADSLLQEP